MKILMFICAFSSFQLSFSLDKKEEELSKDAQCAGCEAVVKALSNRLFYNSKEKLEVEIPKVLRTICDENNYQDSEFSPSKVRSACLQLLKKRKTDMTKVLVNVYSKKKQSNYSYLDLSKKVCSDTLGICDRQTMEGTPTEGKVIFNDETQEFEVIMGDNVRIPKPYIPDVGQSQKLKATETVLRADPIEPLKPTLAGHDEL